jgi:alpha-L-rhamnosidase
MKTDLGPETPGFAQLTPVALTATAIYYYDVKLMAEMAVQSGHPKEAERFRDWAGEIKTAFNSKFYDSENHTYATGSQTALSMPLVVGLVEEQNREGVLESLKKTIVQRDEKALTAGDVGFHFLIEALTEGGLDELIFEMNARDDVPGYGYQLKKGATALTESWQALKRVSNNHLMLGHIMQWFYEGLGGIRQTDRSVGFKELFLAPSVLNEIDTVTCSFESPYGIVSSNWKKDETSFSYYVEIPVNCEAVVTVPVLFSGVVTEDGVPVDKSGELNVVERDSDHVKIKVGSGAYHFRNK